MSTQPRRTRSKADTITGAATQVQSIRGALAMQEAARGAERLRHVAKQFANADHINHVAGRVFEEMHAATANVDAALKGLPQRFATTASEGQPTATADIVVKIGKKTVSAAQAKLSESSTTLLTSVSDKAYDGMQKILPADKVETVRDMAKKLASAGRRPDLSLEDTAKRATSKIAYKGASSKPVTVKEAQSAARNSKAAGHKLQADTTRAAYGSAAAMGGAVSGVLSLASGGSASDVAKATASGAVRGAVHQAATVGVEKLGTAALSQVSGKAASVLGKSGAAGAIAGAGIGVASDLIDLAKGDIDGAECASRAVKHGVRAGTTWAGAEAGAALGVVGGPVGVAVGAFVGGLIGSMLPDWF